MEQTRVSRFFTRTAWFDGYLLLPGALGNMLDLLLVSLSINLLSLAVPLAVMQVYDRVIPNVGMNTFWWLMGGATLAIILDSILRWTRSVMNGRLMSQFDHLVGRQVMERVLNCRLEDYEQVSVGEQMDRLSAVTTLSNYYVGQVIQTLLDLPFAILLLYAVGYLGGYLVMIPLGLILIYLILILIARRRFYVERRQQLETKDRRFDFVIQVLQGLHLIKAQTMEEQMLRRYERLQASTAENNLRTGFWSHLPAEIGLAFSQLSMFALIALGSPLVREGLLTIGGLSACMMLAGRALQPIQGASQFWLRYSDANIARERIQKIADMRPFRKNNPPRFCNDLRGAVELHSVTFRYRPELPPILCDAELSVPVGTQIGIIGSSASGTTTLLLLIRGMLNTDNGSVLLDNYNLAEWDTNDMRGRVEYIPSRGTLFRGSILDNIAMFDSSRQAAALEAAALLGLDDMVAMLPMGYETGVDNQASNILPMGLIQRISIARALVERPRILLFDKTDAALDQDSERVFLWLLERLRGHCTVIVVSNRTPILRRMETLFEIEEGRIVRRTQSDLDRSVAPEIDLF